MPRKLQFKLDFDEDINSFVRRKHPQSSDFRILSKSLDARGAPKGKKPVYHYIIESIEAGEEFDKNEESFSHVGAFTKRPLIIGAGPAGLFAALRFVEYGVPCTVIERGDVAHKRMLAISQYWKHGVLNTENNVCFGEGGAGLFSDGKLITRVKSPYIKYVMQKFVDFGAPEEVAYLSNPHLGSNKIRKLIGAITDYLKSAGCEFIYNDRVDELLFNESKVTGARLKSGKELFSEHTILAAGHSAAGLYHHIIKNNVATKLKDFAVGVRIEHPRVSIDQIQHGEFFQSEELGTAKYRLSYHEPSTDRGTYSFCMCPGGYVLSSGTQEAGFVVNGMSNYARNSRWSNSAIVVSVKAGEDFNAEDPLAGLEFQESIERKAYETSVKEADGKMLPAMTVAEFLAGKLNSQDLPKTSCPSGLFKTDIRKIFPDFINEHLKTALLEFDRKMPGFSSSDALLIAPETRTSAPMTILRDKDTLRSLSHEGLYPCGEGAGYAGGITSAAVDGIKVVESIIASRK